MSIFVFSFCEQMERDMEADGDDHKANHWLTKLFFFFFLTANKSIDS